MQEGAARPYEPPDEERSRPAAGCEPASATVIGISQERRGSDYQKSEHEQGIAAGVEHYLHERAIGDYGD